MTQTTFTPTFHFKEGEMAFILSLCTEYIRDRHPNAVAALADNHTEVDEDIGRDVVDLIRYLRNHALRSWDALRLRYVEREIRICFGFPMGGVSLTEQHRARILCRLPDRATALDVARQIKTFRDLNNRTFGLYIWSVEVSPENDVIMHLRDCNVEEHRFLGRIVDACCELIDNEPRNPTTASS